jgi:hypothetical protein
MNSFKKSTHTRLSHREHRLKHEKSDMKTCIIATQKRVKSCILVTVCAIAVTATTPVFAQNVQNEIRATTVVNMCNMYQDMFRQLISMRGTRGYTDDILMELADSDPNPTVQRFLKVTAGRLARTNSEVRIDQILTDRDTFTQPCYNAMAGLYDSPPSVSNDIPRSMGAPSGSAESPLRDQERSPSTSIYSNNRR